MPGETNINKSASIAAGLAFDALVIPALVLGQMYPGDIGIDPEDVQLDKAEYSPHLDQGYPDRVYFGDTHAHTSSEQIVLDAAAAYWPGGVGSPLNYFCCV